MPSFAGAVVQNQIILTSAVAVSGKAPAEYRYYPSLLDTGSQLTLVSEKIVKEVGLQAYGDGALIPVSGQPLRADKFRVRIDIPISGEESILGGGVRPNTMLMGMDIDALLLPYQPPNYDVLLGLDFISAFHLTLFRGQFILSI